MTKKELSDTLGLSCVEKYFLAWIKNYCDESKLYFRSFIGINRVLQDFLWGAEYERYSAVSRLQELAERCGIVKHEYFNFTAESAFKFLTESCSDELTLIRASPAFFNGVKRVPWRKDHFLYVDGNLNWLNEYPLSEGKFSKEEFIRSYGGAVCRYQYTGGGTVPSDENAEAIRRQDGFVLPDLTLKGYESAVGILRITRKRLLRYYAENEKVCNLLQQETAFLDAAYFEARRLMLREAETEKDTVRQHIKRGLIKLAQHEKNLKEYFENEKRD